MDVGKAFNPAIDHTAKVLFRPFQIKKWMGLGFVALFAGGSGGSFNFNIPGDFGSNGGPSGNFGDVGAWLGSHIPAIIAGALVLVAISLLLNWLFSVMKLVYVDQITRDSGAIKEPFARLKALGTSFFLWLLAFGFAALVVLAVFVGLPLFAAFSGGVGTVAKVVAVVWAVIVGIGAIAAMLIINIFAHDFVMPAMYVRNVRVMDGWRLVTPVLRENAGQSAVYLLMLMAIAIGSGIAALIIALVMLIVFALPAIVLALLGFVLWQAGAETWTVTLIVYSAVFGAGLFLAYIYATTCALQPLTVFRRAYALVVLGQADPSLATVPVVVAPPMPPQPPPGPGPAPAA
jgi:hypothetical protein